MKEKRPTYNEFKNKALKDHEFKVEYDHLKYWFDLINQFIMARKQAKLSQAELADLLHTKQSAIARFESGGLSTASITRLQAHAEILGYDLEIHLIPKENQQHNYDSL